MQSTRHEITLFVLFETYDPKGTWKHTWDVVATLKKTFRAPQCQDGRLLKLFFWRTLKEFDWEGVSNLKNPIWLRLSL